MTTPSTVKRPFGVTLVVALIVLAAVMNLLVGALAIFSSLGKNPTITDLTGTEHPIPTWILLVNGAMAILLGLMYLWLARMTLAGSRSAQTLISALTVINIIFALFNLPSGWVNIVVNAAILVLVQTKAAKEWFSQLP